MATLGLWHPVDPLPLPSPQLPGAPQNCPFTHHCPQRTLRPLPSPYLSSSLCLRPPRKHGLQGAVWPSPTSPHPAPSPLEAGGGLHPKAPTCMGMSEGAQTHESVP